MKKTATLISFILFTFNLMAQETTKLIYFADPMCSWCYGFSPELTKVLETSGEAIEFQMVMGGLRPYNTETMTQLGDFLAEHWGHVAERSGQPFDHSILKDTSFVYDTEPACRAVAVVRELQPSRAYEFFKAVQTAFYKDNKNTNVTQTYLDLVEDFGIDRETFRKAFESEEWKAKIKEDFEYSANIGVRGFPTLVLQKGKELYLLSNGYVEAKTILDKIANIE